MSPATLGVKTLMEDKLILDELAACERSVWDALMVGDCDADRALLDEQFLGVYPDGFAGKEDHCGQLSAGPTVQHYVLSDLKAVPLGRSHALLAYKARYIRTVCRDTEEMFVSSIWRRDPDGWINIFSQDTPATGFSVP